MATTAAGSVEVCDFCSASLAEQHQHLLQPSARTIECACDACAILFSGGGQTKHRRIPRRIRFLRDFQMTDLDWNGLGIPIGVAFIFHSTTAGGPVALYPSPGGAIESSLPLETWQETVRENPILETMEPDVEGLLVYRIGKSRDHFLLPIDECFKLVGIIRLHWKGFSGGTELWSHVEGFLGRLKQ